MRSVFPIVVAVVGLWLHPLIIVVGVVTLFFFIASHCLIPRWSDHVTSHAHSSRTLYYAAMDKLLTQLTVTIRWLQEMEVISRGLTRPHPSLPVAQLDQNHTHKHLRKRVICTCADILCLLRVATRDLCGMGGVCLPPELGDKGSYLAFRNLQELHQYLAEDEGQRTVEWNEEEEGALHLQSIKASLASQV